MTVDELIEVLQMARKLGMPGDAPVKLFNHDAKQMCNVISQAASCQARMVQQYDTSGAESRNKYMLIGAVELSRMSAS